MCTTKKMAEYKTTVQPNVLKLVKCFFVTATKMLNNIAIMYKEKDSTGNHISMPRLLIELQTKSLMYVSVDSEVNIRLWLYSC